MTENKRFQVYLNASDTRKAQIALENLGYNLSQYLRMHLRQLAEEVEGTDLLTRSPEDRTREEFRAMLHQWVKTKM